MVPGLSRTNLAMVGMMGLSTESIREDWRFMGYSEEFEKSVTCR
jgi:hypothetical protein